MKTVADWRREMDAEQERLNRSFTHNGTSVKCCECGGPARYIEEVHQVLSDGRVTGLTFRYRRWYCPECDPGFPRRESHMQHVDVPWGGDIAEFLEMLARPPGEGANDS